VPKSLRTPLAAETLELLANELSGQIVYNNLVKLAGAPWVREPKEFPGTFYESQAIYDMVRAYGLQTTRLERQKGDGTYDYPTEGEFWVLEPQRRLLARLDADPALVARGSATADVTGELVYVAPGSPTQIKQSLAAGSQRPRVALMWSHPSDAQAQALAASGVQAVVAFNSRERYFDPNQVVYSSGAYEGHDPLRLGISVSWRQWSELFEDLQLGRKLVVRCRARVEKYPQKYESVYSWIPGTEPQAKGVVFTAHLFDGYTKRGANDNMSGCVVQLEILRGLTRRIAAGELPRPRRTIYFLWPQEISGTYAFLKEHPDFGSRASVNLNMDMVGEGLRQNNGVLRMSECPGYLPSYVDGLAKSIMDYVGRTNDIIFMADVPRGRPGGQYFPIPMLEKNGSLDAFRYTILPTFGGTDHVCFLNPAVGVPGLAFLVWPDQWYHADTDTPDKADPTQLKRVAFIGAACAWAAAQCTDEVAAGLADAASAYGYQRVAERELPRAMTRLEAADRGNLAAETAQALRLVRFGAGRELAAVRSIEDVFTGSPAARRAVDAKARQWDLYRTALGGQVLQYAAVRAAELGVPAPGVAQSDDRQRALDRVVPAIAPSVKGHEFDLPYGERYQKYVKQHPEAAKAVTLARRQTLAVLNYVDGRRSVAQIRDCVAAELDEDLPLAQVAAYLDLLRAAGCLAY
jgi:hypothetical protein